MNANEIKSQYISEVYYLGVSPNNRHRCRFFVVKFEDRGFNFNGTGASNKFIAVNQYLKSRRSPSVQITHNCIVA